MGDLQDIQNILLIYEHASGQQINRDKTTVFFQQSSFVRDKGGHSNFFGGDRN